MPFDTTNVRLPTSLVRSTADVERRFLAAVYRWMALGLALTALVAFAVAGSDAALQVVFGTRFLLVALLLAEVGLVVALSAAVRRLSAAAAGALFVLYSALNGVTLSSIFLVYTHTSIATALLVAAGAFGAMSVFGTVTRRDLSSWSSFLLMGLIGVVIASLVNMFLRSDAMAFVISCASVVVFTGLTAYDTQKLRAFARAGGTSVAAAPVAGALSLYLDFVNLFLALLRLFGRRR
ncbi:MAG TPA: Bax inhibitor-1/YccA family protein [Anaeromyxobacter sp.]|nr:Bax inhibitor-1/YccA family protein [Anaeromyxobacter sp.]